MAPRLTIADIGIDVVFKDIKNVHLSVYPPVGRVRISAPSRMGLDTIRLFAISKLEWIRQQQRKLNEQERETPREYLTRESHYVWGKRYLLEVVEQDAPAQVDLKHSQIIVQVRPGSSAAIREATVYRWYRQQLKSEATGLIAKWEPLLGVKIERFFVQRMKTRWGSCNERARTIRLNSELAKKPKECVEYIVVHEMVHLLERHHNDRFRALMDRLMPQWRLRREELNREPLAHEDWGY